MVRCHGGSNQDTDAVIIIFEEKRNHVYILSDSQDRLNEKEYLDSILCLVHDLSVDFCVHRILLKKPAWDFYIGELLDVCIDAKE